MTDCKRYIAFRRRVDPSLNGLFQSVAMESSLRKYNVESDQQAHNSVIRLNTASYLDSACDRASHIAPTSDPSRLLTLQFSNL